MHDIFISAHPDDDALAQAIRDRLARAGLSVRPDQGSADSEGAFQTEDNGAAEACRIAIPVLTPRWQTSDSARFEVSGAPLVLPVLCEGEWEEAATPPLEAWAAIVPVVDLRADEERDWLLLVAAAREELNRPACDLPPRVGAALELARDCLADSEESDEENGEDGTEESKLLVEERTLWRQIESALEAGYPYESASEIAKPVAVLLHLLGLYLSATIHDEAHLLLRGAVDAWRAAARRSPDDLEGYRQSGDALQVLGALMKERGAVLEARGIMNEAATAYDEAARCKPKDAQARVAKGNACSSLGYLLQSLNKPEEAEQAYRRAIASYDEALRLTDAHLAKGIALASLGDILSARDDREGAMETYEASIASIDEALILLNPHAEKRVMLARPGELIDGRAAGEGGWWSTYDALSQIPTLDETQLAKANYHRGYAWQRLAGQFASLPGKEAEAQNACREAIAAYDEALKGNPGGLDALSHKAAAQSSLGDLLTRQSQYEAAHEAYREATSSYARAVMVYDALLHDYPENTGLMKSKSAAMGKQAELLAALNERERALAIYDGLIGLYEEILLRDPEDAETCGAKAWALQCATGQWNALGDKESAQAGYEETIACYDEALRLMPENAAMHERRGNALTGLADLLAESSQPDAAQKAYEAAVASYDEAIRLQPDTVQARSDKGIALLNLGDLRAGRLNREGGERSNREGAERAYEDALLTFDDVLRYEPENASAFGFKGNALAGLAGLRAQSSHPSPPSHSSQSSQPIDSEAALTGYAQAIAFYDEALRRAPNSFQHLGDKADALAQVGDLRARRADHNGARLAYEAALALHEDILRRDMDDLIALENRGDVLERLGQLALSLGKPQKGMEFLSKAVTCWGRVDELAPNKLEINDKIKQTRDLIGRL